MSEECERGVCECESEVVSVSEWLVEREAKDSTTVCYINSSETENDNINRNKTMGSSSQGRAQCCGTPTTVGTQCCGTPTTVGTWEACRSETHTHIHPS